MAQMASIRAELEAARTVANMQLNARASAAKRVADWYQGDQAQRAITATALKNAPNLLRSIGVEFDVAEHGADLDHAAASTSGPGVSANGHGGPGFFGQGGRQ